MAHILIVYGTTEGHTRKVAHRIAEMIRARGHTTDVWDSTATPEAERAAPYDAIIVGASIHLAKHQRTVRAYVRAAAEALQSLPSAFFSVSMTAAQPDEASQAEARQYAEAFLAETGWKPDRTWSVAGALRYTHYGFLKRLVMRSIARKEGHATDTSRDYEYTDWPSLRRSVEEFLDEVVRPARAEKAVLGAGQVSEL